MFPHLPTAGQLDLVSYNSAISACARAAAWSQALAVLEALQGLRSKAWLGGTMNGTAGVP